jgi:predicted heme/steroid binding protein
MIKYNKIIISFIVIMVLGLLITGCTNVSGSVPATSQVQPSNTNSDTAAKTFTSKELQKYDGQNGNPAYVAVNGKVYDVTNVPQWKNGAHHGFNAGNDLTEAIKSAPHGLSVLDKVPVVGDLVN